MVNTTLIIEVIAIIFLIGILAYIAVVMFSRPKPDGPPGKNCWAGTKYNAAYTDNGASGCISTPETPVSESECKNGIWMSSTADGSKGYCVCNKSFFGKNCDKECGSDVPCPSGSSCINGKCTSEKCKCLDGWTCSSGYNCDTCLPGRGPAGDCSKKLITKPLYVYLPCMGASSHPSTINNECIRQFGSNAKFSEYANLNHANPNPCTDILGIGKRRYVCEVPKYYAAPTFNPSTWNPLNEVKGKIIISEPDGFEPYRT